MKRCTFLLIFLFPAAMIYAQGFTGPGSSEQPVMVSHPITSNEARNLPHDSWVTLNGNIINALPGGKHYMFRDSSGEITVEIGPKEWRGLTVGVSDRIEISGEVKLQRGQVSIKVKAIAGHGETISGRYASSVRLAGSLPHDSWVVLTGSILNALPGGKEYTFRDSSGEVTVEIGRKEWRGLSVGVSDRVEINGEVKIKNRQVSIKVHAIRKI